MTKLMRWSLRYGVALLAVVTALGSVFIPVIGPGLGSFLFLAVLVSAQYGGLGPGLFATALITTLLGLGLIFLEPDKALWRFVGLLVFAGGGVVVTLLVEAMHAARRRVEAGQRWLTAVLTSIGDGVIAADAQGRASFLNPVARDLTGWETDEAVGKPVTEILRMVTEETRAAVENPITRALREGIVAGLADHTVLIARDGTERPIDDSSAPIREKGGAITGAVLVFRDVTERRRAEGALRRAAREMEHLSRRLIRAEEDERRRIARELHDETGQALTAIKMQLQGVVQVLDEPAEVRARLEESIRLIERTHRQVRSISLDLRPSLLDDLGLVAALQSYVKRQGQLAGLATRFLPVADPPAFRLEPELETACFRVAQEALTNVVRHAGARTVDVELHLGERALRLRVRDDGVGFDVSKARSRAAGGISLGVLSMEERVTLVGGKFAIDSRVGQGTEISAEFPLTLRPTPRI